MGNGYWADSHEFTLTPQGTALLLNYNAVRRNEGRVLEAVVQEIDIPTGLVLFEWHSIGNIATSESYRPQQRRDRNWDYAHVNAISVDAGGDFILSARGASAVYKISRATGRVIWRLGGKRRTLRWVRASASTSSTTWARSRRHTDDLRQRRGRCEVPGADDQARRRPRDARGRSHAPSGPPLEHPGRNAAVAERQHVRRLGLATVVHRVRRGRQGRLRRPACSRHGQHRAYRGLWAGTPKTKPTVVRKGGRLYVSWNGATEVAAWQVGEKAYPRTGFETACPRRPPAPRSERSTRPGTSSRPHPCADAAQNPESSRRHHYV